MNKDKFSFNLVREKFRIKHVKRVSLVVTYHFSLNRTNNIIDKLYLLHIYDDIEIYPLTREVGLCRCSNSRCQVYVSVNKAHVFFFRDSGNLKI